MVKTVCLVVFAAQITTIICLFSPVQNLNAETGYILDTSTYTKYMAVTVLSSAFSVYVYVYNFFLYLLRDPLTQSG